MEELRAELKKAAEIKEFNVDMDLLEAKVKINDLADAYPGIVKLWNKVQSGELSMEKATDEIEELRRRLK